MRTIIASLRLTFLGELPTVCSWILRSAETLPQPRLPFRTRYYVGAQARTSLRKPSLSTAWDWRSGQHHSAILIKPLAP